MVASCYRRSGNYAAALDEYKKIHQKFPDNIECMLDFYYWKSTSMKLTFLKLFFDHSRFKISSSYMF